MVNEVFLLKAASFCHSNEIILYISEKEYLDYRLRSVKKTVQQDNASDETGKNI